MPYFKFILSGSGIDALLDENDASIGFFTTRLVRETDLLSARILAEEIVLSEWREGGAYAACNRGGLPSIKIEQSYSVGFLQGFFGRKPSGYSFYRQED
ncbi:hypothetical protein [Pseudoxanthomonas sp. GM95]|uniref:hypothetical protein n=1 Tax=Pseudoxanthomonas sp. GM95 TaxID=1881043 RepID=UPI0011144170|nr:hypothetical protein [Pseudoxanthomonas sp. GM95]